MTKLKSVISQTVCTDTENKIQMCSVVHLQLSTLFRHAVYIWLAICLVLVTVVTLVVLNDRY